MTNNLKPLKIAIALALVSMASIAQAAPILIQDVGDHTDASVSNNTNPASGYLTTNVEVQTDSRAVTGETENNTGIISNAQGVGIKLDADSTADATSRAGDARYGQASITASAQSEASASSVAIVGGNNGASINSVSNSGTISAYAGIELRATAEANATSYSVSDAWANTDGSSANNDYNDELPTSNSRATAAATADATIKGNLISNTGIINATNVGINLAATSNSVNLTDSTAHGTKGETPGGGGFDRVKDISQTTASAVSSASLHSYVEGNTINNSGSIVVSNGHGINLESLSGLNSTSAADYYLSGQPGVSADVSPFGGNRTLDSYSYVHGNSINHSGIIAAAGTNSDGVKLYAESGGINSEAYVSSNVISNTGKIYAGRDGVSLMAYAEAEGSSWYQEVSANTITNTYGARIVAGRVGINVGDVDTTTDGNTITNSGLIVSDPGMSLNGTVLTKSNKADWDANAATAIKIEGSSETPGEGYIGFNTLNLQAPGYIAGRILLDTQSETNVNLTSGISHSVRWAIQRDASDGTIYAQNNQASPYAWVGGSTTFASLSGTVPWFVNQSKSDVNGKVNDVYATIDPSAFAAAPNQLADLSSMVSAVSRDGMAKNTDATDGFWVTAQGGVMNYDGNNTSTMKQDNNLYTIAVGYNTTVSENYRVGLVAGYSDATFKTGSFYSDLYEHSYNNKAKGGYLGARAATNLGPFNVDAGLSVGFQNHEDKRFVNDNLVWWGQSTASSSYNGYWFSPEVGLSLPIPAFAGFTVSPNVRLSYSGQHIDSYTETGTNSNATIDSRYIGVFEGKAGLNIANTLGPVDVSAEIGYMGRTLTSDDKVKVTMIGDIHDVSFFYRDVNAGYFKAKANLNINDKVQAGLTANYTNGTNVEGGNVMGTVKVNF